MAHDRSIIGTLSGTRHLYIERRQHISSETRDASRSERENGVTLVSHVHEPLDTYFGRRCMFDER